jgi:predicted dienelactone hydrolase
LLFAALVGAALCAGAAQARTVGERHVLTTDRSAALRDAGHRPQVRVTIWYPAVDIVEQRIDLGPPDRPLFEVGAVAPDAAFEDEHARPVILFSHGFGGTARMMAWFGAALARAGYVVIAVDHPGNNGIDTMTPAGAVLHWARADDLRAALQRVASDPVLGPHIDRSRVGVAGYSAGGFTALVASGARADP